MARAIRRLLVVLSLLGFGLGAQAWAQHRPPLMMAAASSTPPLELGRERFIEKGCVNCHNTDGAKPLAKGPPLSERHLSEAALEKTVKGRLRGLPASEQHAVALFIASLMNSAE